MSKHKPALPERLYYRLADAAQLLGCTTDDLVHLGMRGEITICANIYGLATGLSMHADTEDEYIAPPENMPDGVYGIYPDNLRFIDMPNQHAFELGGAVKAAYGKFWHVEFDPPVAIDAEYLVVLPGDIVAISDGQRCRANLPAQKKPHGNAENHARNREAVLRAAIAVKANFPDLCGTYRDWAETIDAKAPFFWPETGIPPLKPETVERLLSDSHKLPDGK